MWWVMKYESYFLLFVTLLLYICMEGEVEAVHVSVDEIVMVGIVFFMIFNFSPLFLCTGK